MAKHLIDSVDNDLKLLIKHLTNHDEQSTRFRQIHREVRNKLKSSHVVQFVNKREVDQCIDGMANKYVFHNFPAQAKALRDSYDEYMSTCKSSDEQSDCLNMVMLLVGLSDRPTSKFLENPEKYAVKEKEVEEDVVDWGRYLLEGIDRWDPKFDETSASSDSSADEDVQEEQDGTSTSTLKPTTLISSMSPQQTVVDFKANREELLNTIQHSWYNQDKFHDTPYSEWREANIGILWDKHLEKQTMGLVDVKSNILSEYKVIREILWQLWVTHSSAVFEFEGNQLKVRGNVTISSVRQVTFESFMSKEFLPYIEVMEFFREFSQSLGFTNQAEEYEDPVPSTYRSYYSAVENIIRPVYKKIVEIEDKVRQQETTYTLLNLTKDLADILKPAVVLRKIHEEVVIDFKENDNVQCALTLLSRLHKIIQFAESKLDHDIRVTLYLGSLYHYLTLVDFWLVRDYHADNSGDFLVKKTWSDDNCKSYFEVGTKIDLCDVEDGLLKIIGESVVQFGNNLFLLRQLGNFPLLDKSNGSIYEEFISKSLEELCRFFGIDKTEYCKKPVEEMVSEEEEVEYKYPVVCIEDCKRPTEMDRLENLVDTSDGFLMLAFEEFFIEKPVTSKEEKEEPPLLEKISKICKTFFPVANFFEKILDSILKERFSMFGLMVKKVLIEKYLVAKHFQFLRHVFLFFDDLIFPFYRRLFENIITDKENWGNDIWLTSSLQDVVMDIYPEFYEICSVHVDSNWEHVVDALHSCNMVSPRYEIQWPLDIIIKPLQMDMYKKLFRYIFKLKWGLYTLNHLCFTDLQPKGKKQRAASRMNRNTTKKLQYLKFVLTNLMNSIQHYIFSFIFTKCLQKFELDFEKAYDLSSIIQSHAQFISTTSVMITDIPKNEEVLCCIRDLDYVWNNTEFATIDKLNDINQRYMNALNAIKPIICPKYIFDY